MTRHIVMWKLPESVSAETKKNTLKTMKDKLLSMQGKIEVLKSIEVSLNLEEVNASNYDIILETEFESQKDIATYLSHPVHQEVAVYIKSLDLQRAAIDFTL